MYSKTEHDTTEALWDRLFMVKVPQLQATSIEYLKQYGTYITGDKLIDKYNTNAYMTTYLSIEQMVTLFQNNVSIKVVQYEDTKKIYDIIHEHLSVWADHLKHGLNIGDAPIEDLIEMDKFAEVIYPYAKNIANHQEIKSLLHNRVQNRFKFSTNNILQQDKSNNHNNEEKQESGYESFSEILKRRVSLIKDYS